MLFFIRNITLLTLKVIIYTQLEIISIRTDVNVATTDYFFSGLYQCYCIHEMVCYLLGK